MPNASEYQNAAERFRRQSRLLTATAIELTSGSRHWLTGPVAAHHDEAMLDVRRHLIATGRALEHLAAVAERRGVICSGYATMVSQYERLDPWVRLLTPRPQRPAAWVEV